MPSIMHFQGNTFLTCCDTSDASSLYWWTDETLTSFRLFDIDIVPKLGCDNAESESDIC